MAPYLDPINEAFAAIADAAPQPEQLGYAAARQAIEDLQKQDPASDIAVQTFEVLGEYGPTPVSIFRPKATENQLCKVVLFTHGGGWVLGSPTVYAPLLEDLARQSEAAVVFPDYTLAPQKQYPFQFEQTYAVLEHVVQHGCDYKLQADPIVLAGDSAGGHLVIVLMQMALERHLTATIPQLIIFNPVTVAHKKMESYETYKNGPFLTANTMNWFLDAFLPDKKDRENALTSPLTHLSDEILRNFPPTLLILSDLDPLVDEGRAFGHRLQQAGVDTAIIRGVGQVHASFLFRPTRVSATARAVVELAAMRIRKGLELP